MKKRTFRFGFSLLLALALVLSLSVTAFAAESTVTFNSGKVIAFEPGSAYTGSDLFDNFKGIMPGDTLTEEITIQNKNRDYDYIKVYLRAVLHDRSGNPISEDVLEELRDDDRRETTELKYMHDFLSQLSMKVWKGSKLIYEDSPDQKDGLAERVYLGTIRRGKTIKLDVELDVPIEMGNEYSNRIGEVDWEFVVEGFDDSDDSDSLIQTGQLNWPIAVMGGLGLLFVALGMILMAKKRKNDRA